MPLSLDLNVSEDYVEQYREGTDGRIEVDDDIITRYMPECGGNEIQSSHVSVVKMG
jgi:hypothetical protein